MPKRSLVPEVRVRKRPRQRRSKATVEVILRATEQCLIRYGASKLTTTLVAERAGVSIGTLYQYYPNQSSLISSLVEDYGHREKRLLESVLTADDTLATMAEKVVRAYFAPVAKKRALFVGLIQALNTICRPSDVRRLERAGIRRLQVLLKKYGCRKSDLDRTAFTFYYTFIGLLRFAALIRPELLDDELFVQEVVAMVHVAVGAT